MLKKKVDDIEAVDEPLRGLYRKSGDAYFLDVEDDDYSTMRSALDHEKNKRKASTERVKELERLMAERDDALENLQRDKAEKTSNPEEIKKLEKTWADKLTKLQGDLEQRVSAREAQIRALVLDSTADQLANKISTVPSLLSKAIKERLAVDLDNDKPTVKVLNADGTYTGAGLDALEKELMGNKELAAIMKTTLAKGTAATQPSARAPTYTSERKTNADLSGMSSKDLAAIIREKLGSE